MAFEFYCLEEEAYYSLEFPNPSDEEIDGAATEVFLETYIFAALRRAADRGVTVRLMVDGFDGREFVAIPRRPCGDDPSPQSGRA